MELAELDWRYKPDSKVDQITTRLSFQTLEPVVTIRSRTLKCYNLNMVLPSGLPKPCDPVVLGQVALTPHILSSQPSHILVEFALVTLGFLEGFWS